jgi:hypothetical protein
MLNLFNDIERVILPQGYRHTGNGGAILARKPYR